jgi:ribonuclease HI
VGSSAVLYFDGSSKPGSCKIGGVLKRLGEEDVEYSDPLPDCTCNEAEYHALIRGLKLATNLGVTDLTVFGDSMLVVMHTKGKWKCKKKHLQILLSDVAALKLAFDAFSIDHVDREHNTRADSLTR